MPEKPPFLVSAKVIDTTNLYYEKIYRDGIYIKKMTVDSRDNMVSIDDKPAVIEKCMYTNVVSLKWPSSRTRGPTEIRYAEDRCIMEKLYKKSNGEYHRLNGPAVIRYWKNGNKREEIWYEYGIIVRWTCKRPAIKYYRYNGTLETAIWTDYEGQIVKEETYRDGKLSEMTEFIGENITKTTEFFSGIKTVEWKQEGMLHRLEGPCVTKYSNGELYLRKFCICHDCSFDGLQNRICSLCYKTTHKIVLSEGESHLCVDCYRLCLNDNMRRCIFCKIPYSSHYHNDLVNML